MLSTDNAMKEIINKEVEKNETVCDLSSIELTEENLSACVYIYRYLINYY